MNIFFCDDEKNLSDRYKEIASNYITDKFSQLNIKTFSVQTAFDLLVLMKETETTAGIYFLDIDLKNKSSDGIQLAQEIRIIDPHAKIAFISTREELIVETIRQKINTLNFIFKDEGLKKVESEIKDTIHVAIMQFELELPEFSDNQKFTFMISDQQIEVLIKEIFYFETLPRGSKKVRIKTKNSDMEFIGSMRNVERELPDFIRSHRSFLVNKDNVRRIDLKKKKLYFDNEVSCDFSFRKEADMKKLFG